MAQDVLANNVRRESEEKNASAKLACQGTCKQHFSI